MIDIVSKTQLPILALTLMLFFGISISHSKGQDSLKTGKNFEFGLSFSIDNCFLTTDFPDKDKLYEEQIKSEANSVLGYHFGGTALYNINSRFTLRTDLLYNRVAFNRYVYVQGQDMVWNEAQYQSRMNYLSIPVRTSYRIWKGKYYSFFSLGLSTDIFLKAKARIKENPDSNDGETYFENIESDFKQIRLAALGSVGLGYKNENIHLIFEPIIRYSLSPVNKEERQFFVHSFGFQVGAVKSF